MNEINAKVRSYFKGVKDLTVMLIVKPAGFFRTMPKSGGFLEPLLYVIITSVLAVILNVVEMFMLRGAGAHDFGMAVAWLIIVPPIIVILSFFFAGICYAAWAFMGSREDFETSYRCLAYMQIFLPALTLLSFVPYLGLLGFAWWLYLMVTATREVHKVPVMPALAVFGVIAALSGLAYYNSVTSTLEAKQRLEDYTKELQKMPGKIDNR